jgi:hypothetical protein
MQHESFWMVKNHWKCETVIDFMVFSYSGKCWKIDAEMAPKIHENRPKIEPWADRMRLWQLSGRFWPMLKKHVFLIPLQWLQKSEKSVQGPAWRSLRCERATSRWGSARRGRPRARQETRYSKHETRIMKQRDNKKQASKDDLTRPVARRIFIV